MNAANDIAEFLASRRAKITPEQAGLPSYGKRRVPGLRREEVASLAGVSADYYRRLERGQVSGVSELVLEALARALQLDDAERTHLFDLARAASPVAPKRSRPLKTRVRPVVQRLLDQIEAPAIVSTVHGDYLAANALGRALYAPVFESPEQPANSGRFTFLDPAARDFYPEWERLASELVAALRSQAGRNPYDRSLQDLIGELSTRSDEFRVRWAAHNVRFHRTGTKRLHHPIVGELELSYETLTLDADDGLRLALYTAEAGSASQQALDLLASWTATPEPAPRPGERTTDDADDDSCNDPCPDAQQRRHDARPRPGRLPEPARGDHGRRRDGAARRLPADRHRRRLRQRARGRRGVRASGLDRSEVFLETKLWISDYGYDETLHGFEKSAGKLGVDQSTCYSSTRRCRPHSTARSRPTGPPETLLADGRVARHRRQQLHGRAPDARCSTAPTSCRPSTRSRCTPTSPSPTSRPSTPSCGILTQAWSPIGGIPSTARAGEPPAAR